MCYLWDYLWIDWVGVSECDPQLLDLVIGIETVNHLNYCILVVYVSVISAETNYYFIVYILLLAIYYRFPMLLQILSPPDVDLLGRW